MRRMPVVSLGRIVATIAVLGALAAACTTDDITEDPLLCSFDGDASPGYQEVWIDAYASDGSYSYGAGFPLTSAPAGATVPVPSVVVADLLTTEENRGTLCDREVSWEVLAGGGTLSAPTSNTGTTQKSPFPQHYEYIGLVYWTLGAPGVQTLHGYLTDDHSIDVSITLTASALPPINTVEFRNSTSNIAYLVGPGESPVAATRVPAHESRQVAIPLAIGSPSTFRAYETPDVFSVEITCMVTGTAWTGGGQPLVEFTISGGHFLSCSNGLVAP